MTIADIFDALTASDRPYKKAVPDRPRARDPRERGQGRQVRRRPVPGVRRGRGLQEGDLGVPVATVVRGRAATRARPRDPPPRRRPGARGPPGPRPRPLVGDPRVHRRRRDPRAQPHLPPPRSRHRRAVVPPAGAGGRDRSGGGRHRARRHRHLRRDRPPPRPRHAASSPSSSGSPSTASATCSATTTRRRPRRRGCSRSSGGCAACRSSV